MKENALTDEELMQLEYLVDGELPHLQCSRLLSRLDQVPGGWKTCALMFLEHQVLSSELPNWIQRQQSETPSPQNHRNYDSQQHPLPISADLKLAAMPSYASASAEAVLPPEFPLSNPSQPSRFDAAPSSQRYRKGTWLVLAASMALAFLGGFRLGDYGKTPTLLWKSGSETDALAEAKLGNSMLTEENVMASQTSPASLGTELTSPHSARPSDFSTSSQGFQNIPVTYTEPFDSSLLESKERSIVRLNSLVEAELERVQTFLPYKRADGQEIVVPVQSLKFRPIAVHGF